MTVFLAKGRIWNAGFIRWCENRGGIGGNGRWYSTLCWQTYCGIVQPTSNSDYNVRILTILIITFYWLVNFLDSPPLEPFKAEKSYNSEWLYDVAVYDWELDTCLGEIAMKRGKVRNTKKWYGSITLRVLFFQYEELREALPDGQPMYAPDGSTYRVWAIPMYREDGSILDFRPVNWATWDRQSL